MYKQRVSNSNNTDDSQSKIAQILDPISHLPPFNGASIRFLFPLLLAHFFPKPNSQFYLLIEKYDNNWNMSAWSTELVAKTILTGIKYTINTLYLGFLFEYERSNWILSKRFSCGINHSSDIHGIPWSGFHL